MIKMKKMMEYTNKKMRLFCVSILFFNCIILSVVLNIDTYIYDSYYYWNIADPVFNDGNFNIMLFPETFRGCLFPLSLLFAKKICKGVWGWRIMSSIMVSTLFGIFVPKIMKHQISAVKDVFRIIAAELVFFYIWGQFLQYPLSDLPAYFFFVAGIYFDILLIELFEKRDNAIFADIKKLIFGGVSGACLYVAYNCRAAFLYGVMIVAVVMTYNMVKQKSVKQLMLVVMGALIGISIVSFPQCAINRQYVGEFSPKVYTEAYTNYNSDLQATQVLWGLSYPRYESYAGDMDKYESASVYFDDIVGNRIIVEEGISAETFKLATILRIFIKYPLDTIGIYTRHLISIATPAWNQAYITNIYTNKIFIVLLSIALWLLGGLNVFANLNRNSFQSANAGFVVSICVPPFLQLFGAPELRFFLPVYILLYVYVFLEIDFLEIAMYIKHRWLSIVVTMLFIIILWLTVFGDILALNREIPLLINDICR